jgi:hypothetical protein
MRDQLLFGLSPSNPRLTRLGSLVSLAHVLLVSLARMSTATHPWRYSSRRPADRWNSHARFRSCLAFLMAIRKQLPAEIRRMICDLVIHELFLVLTNHASLGFSLQDPRVLHLPQHSLRCVHISGAPINFRTIRIRLGFQVLDQKVLDWITDLESRLIASQLPEIRKKFRSCIKGDCLSYSFDVQSEAPRYGIFSTIDESYRGIVDEWLQTIDRDHHHHDGEFGKHYFSKYVHRDSLVFEWVPLKRGETVSGPSAIRVFGLSCCKRVDAKMRWWLHLSGAKA